MSRVTGVALAAFLAGACGHVTPLGSAQNDWATPTGHGSATNARSFDPEAAAHPARDRSVFARRPSAPAGDVAVDATTATPVAPEPRGAVPPPPETLPPPETVPDIAPPDTGPLPRDTVPPYATPIAP